MARGRKIRQPEAEEEEIVAAPAKPKKAVKPYTITPKQFDELWDNFHVNKEKAREDGKRLVNKDALAAMILDHGQQPAGLVLEEHRKNVTVNRAALWEFLMRMRKTYQDWDRELSGKS